MKLKHLLLSLIIGTTVSVSIGAVTSNSVSSSNSISSINNNSNSFTTNDNKTDNIVLSFNANGGTFHHGDKILEVPRYTKFSDIKDKVPVVQRDGVKLADFPGWYFTKSSNKVVVDDDTVFNSDVVLYADWNLYVVEFNAGEGIFRNGKQYRSFSDVTVVNYDDIDIPTIVGGVFDCWVYKEREYRQSDFPFSPSGNDRIIRFEAKYTTNTIEVCFNASEGHFDGNVKTKIFKVPYNSKEEDVKKQAGVPSYKDNTKVFASWQGTSQSYITKPVCYFAWYAETYQFTLDVSANGGKWSISNDDINKYCQIYGGMGITFGDALKIIKANYSVNNLDSYTTVNGIKRYSKGWFKDKAGTIPIKDDELIVSNFSACSVYDREYEVLVSSGAVKFDGRNKFDSINYPEGHKFRLYCVDGYEFRDETMVVQGDSSHRYYQKGEDYTFTLNEGNKSGVFTILKNVREDIYIKIDVNRSLYKIKKLYPEGVAYYEGDKVAYAKNYITVKAIPKPGYKITSISYNKTSVKGDTLSISMPSNDIEVSAVAEELTYTISKDVLPTTISSINISNENPKYKEKVTVTVVPIQGYNVSKITLKRKDSGEVYETHEKVDQIEFEVPPYDLVVEAEAGIIKSVVTFNGNGGTPESTTERVEYGNKVSKPIINPRKDNRTFGGWFKDQECSEGNEFDFNTPIYQNTTLYAKWLEGDLRIVESKHNIDPDVDKSVKFTLYVGDTEIKSGVKWESSDTSIATIDDNGNLTPVGAGHCGITASYNDKGVSTDDFEIGSFSKLDASYLSSGEIKRINRQISGKVYVPARYHDGSKFIDLSFYNDSEFMSLLSDGAFYKCTNITSVDIAKGIYTIGCYAFEGCSSLREVKLNDDLVNICVEAFYECTALTSIHIPASVKNIGINSKNRCYAFYGCISLESVIIDSPDVAKKDNPGQGLYDPLTNGELKMVKIPKGTEARATLSKYFEKYKEDDKYDYYQQKQ